MFVIKRNKEQHAMCFDKITKRLQLLATDLTKIDVVRVVQKIVPSIKNGMHTDEIDNLAAEISFSMQSEHIEYATLAGRVAISNLHKTTSSSFCETMLQFDDLDLPLDKLDQKAIDDMIVHDSDYQYSYMAFRTLAKSYLWKIGSKIAERPQYMLMRVALFLAGADMEMVQKIYTELRLQRMTYATPTLFNAGQTQAQLCSCFLIDMKDDLGDIYKTITDCAMISKGAGGIGVNCNKIRAKGSEIKGTKGTSNGLVPMMKVFNETARYVDQGGGKRPGSFAMYISPWHADILDVLELKKNHGKEEYRARDLFYALWVSDLFMDRVQKDADWSLFSPHRVPLLNETYGLEFKSAYEAYERQGLALQTIKARKLWFTILTTQIETGIPYITFKDQVNVSNMQRNIGMIQQSNLCVKGDTMILTSQGDVEIQSLRDKQVTIWNGKSWVSVMPLRTGIDQKLITVSFSNGASITCTPYHKFFIGPERSVTFAKDLKYYDIISKFELPDHMVYTSIYVTSVKDNGEKGDTYCFTEPIEHAGVFNGILAGNCNEIVQVTNDKEVACCNLASIALNKCVHDGKFDYTQLFDTVKLAVYGLNQVIDKNYYPIPETRYSNLKNRPIGLGVQGLADVFMLLRLPWESEEAKKVNKNIFETMYYAAVQASVQLAIDHGPYEAFKGSPYEKGQLHFDTYGAQPSMWDFESLRKDVMQYGVRNSLMIALMPTASTAQILGNVESFEPIKSNLYTRKVLSGEFEVMNKHLVKDLENLGLWGPDMRMKLIESRGSVQSIPEIPDTLKQLYKTVWEIPQKVLIDMAADRAPFVDQTQSMNLFFSAPTISQLTSAHFYSWQRKLKTCNYYIRTQPKTQAMQFTVKKTTIVKEEDDDPVCRMEEGCLSCSA